MIAVTIQELPTSSRVGWAYEPRMDCFRVLAHRGAQRVALHSRQQRPLGRSFPEIVAALRQMGRRGGAGR
jgi:ATP-dependent DNA ligase